MASEIILWVQAIHGLLLCLLWGKSLLILCVVLRNYDLVQLEFIQSECRKLSVEHCIVDWIKHIQQFFTQLAKYAFTFHPLNYFFWPNLQVLYIILFLFADEKSTSLLSVRLHHFYILPFGVGMWVVWHLTFLYYQ